RREATLRIHDQQPAFPAAQSLHGNLLQAIVSCHHRRGYNPGHVSSTGGGLPIMAFRMHKVQVWSGEIPDRPGAAAAKLELLARSGANLEFVFTRPQRSNPEGSVIFLA